MSNTTSKVITTKAGEALIAQMQAENKVLVIDKFVFANVPNRPEFPQREDTVPTADVVHESAVHEQGRLTENSVIYSTTLASDVGSFTFNWSGLYCSEHNTLVAINYPPAIDKTVDGPGVTGNTLVRSFVLEYKGIAETTNITVDPESWQYNAHKRMGKMDNDTSQAIIDQNGKDWFIEDGFIVTPQSTAYNIKAGAGYVSGNRIALEFDRIVQVPDKPSFIYVDAWREGTPTGEWLTKFNFVVFADEKDDYTDAQGIKHFVCKVAQVLADGSVSDLRPEGESAGRVWVSKHFQPQSRVGITRSEIGTISLGKQSYINVSGFSEDGDGGASTWVLVSETAKPENAGQFIRRNMIQYDKDGYPYQISSFIPTSVLEITPECAGAKGDYFDGEGFDNSDVLDDLELFLHDIGGGIIIPAPYSVYGLSRPFDLQHNNVTVRGSGWNHGFGKLTSWTVPIDGYDAVIRTLSSLREKEESWSNWQFGDFAIQCLDDTTSGFIATGLARGCRVYSVATFYGLDGIDLSSCWSMEFSNCESYGAQRYAHALGTGNYGTYKNAIVANAMTIFANTGRSSGLGLLYDGGNGWSMTGCTYELNKQNAWFKNPESGSVSGNYFESAESRYNVRFGGDDSPDAGIAKHLTFNSNMIYGEGNEFPQILMDGMMSSHVFSNRVVGNNPISSNSNSTRVFDNTIRNTAHDETIDKLRNDTDTFLVDKVSQSVTFKTTNGRLFSNTIGEFTAITGNEIEICRSSAIAESIKLVLKRSNPELNTVRKIYKVTYIPYGNVKSEEVLTRGSESDLPSLTFRVVNASLLCTADKDSIVYLTSSGL